MQIKQGILFVEFRCPSLNIEIQSGAVLFCDKTYVTVQAANSPDVYTIPVSTPHYFLQKVIPTKK